jgi:hypothetical protein
MTAYSELRRDCYRCGRGLGDVHAVIRSLETGSPAPACKRCARRYAYRNSNKILRHGLRMARLI